MEAKLEKKFKSILPETFMEEATAAADGAVMDFISKSALAISDTEEKQADDPNILDARAALKDVTQSYKDVIKVHKMKIKFCRILLQERGKI